MNQLFSAAASSAAENSRDILKHTKGTHAMKQIDVRTDGIYIQGKKTLMLSGDLHYFRVLPEGWRRRLDLMKDFGLTAVTTYVPWDMHEPREGQFCFEARFDLPRFLREAQEAGLYVILRCSPYMCAEWDMGGLPAWLLKDRHMALRTSDPAFMEKVEAYNKVLCEKIRPYLLTHGGPILFIGLENEYGSFGNDKEYLKMLADSYRRHGIDVPFISANGVDPFKFNNGTLPENWNGVDAQAGNGGIASLKALQAMKLGKPLMAGEAWVGWFQLCEDQFTLNKGIPGIVDYFRQALEMDAAINFYMFCGGTNFGFTSGAIDYDGGLNARPRYKPTVTSYDYDAPISEEGTPREKYFAMRDVLDDYLGKPRRPHTPPAHPIQSVPTIRLTQSAPLFDHAAALADKVCRCGRTLPMEDLDQNFGFIRYTFHMDYTDDYLYYLRIEGLADRATVYLNRRYIGCYMRDRKGPDIAFRLPREGAEISILVENMGRVDYGFGIYDRKGINGCVHFDIQKQDGSFMWNVAMVMNFTVETLPLDSLEALNYGGKEEYGCPNFFKGSFTAKAGVDTFIDMTGWDKGVVWINGFNIGRYWNSTSQRTLYIPGELLKEENVVEILELHHAPADRNVSMIDHSRLTEPIADPSVPHMEFTQN